MVQAVRALAFRDELADACLALESGAEGPDGFVAVLAHLRQHVTGDHSVLGTHGQLPNMREQLVFLARSEGVAVHPHEVLPKPVRVATVEQLIGQVEPGDSCGVFVLTPPLLEVEPIL